MQLLHDDVAIEPDKPEEKTASGLYRFEAIATYTPFGTVRHCGPNIRTIKRGDRVVYERHGAKVIQEDLEIVSYQAVLAKVK